MSRRTGLIAVVVIALLALQPVARTQVDAHATLHGILQVGEFFGPPNYGENPRGDSIETGFYLQLPATIAVQNPSLRLGPDFGRTGERFVQLVLAGGDVEIARARGLVGRRVRMTGELFPAVTGHHRTSVLMTVETFTEAREWRW